MADDTLDLETGNPELAEADPLTRRREARRAAAKSKESTSSRSKRTSSNERLEAELSSRLTRTLDRIVKALDARDDEELAQIIKEDSEAMAQGIVSLTSSVKWLRSPFIMVLNLVEPVLAFGRITRVLYGRWVVRQQRLAWEKQSAESEAAVNAGT